MQITKDKGNEYNLLELIHNLFNDDHLNVLINLPLPLLCFKYHHQAINGRHFYSLGCLVCPYLTLVGKVVFYKKQNLLFYAAFIFFFLI